MAWDGKKILALSNEIKGNNKTLYDFMLIEGEEVNFEYKSFRDCLIFTTHRLIIIDVQGITGKKKEFMSLNYNKLTSFSIETAGTFDLDSELKLWASGLGMIEFGFTKNSNILQLVKFLSKNTI
ncbi:MAG: PH domain-containing protein [Caulobacterales bacterium]|nr:PH domain-containing protein [Caulobacterales bacterium]